MNFNSMTVVVLAICWPCVIWKTVSAIRNPGNRPLRSLAVALLLITVSLTETAFNILIDNAAGRVDTARAISNALTVVSAAYGQTYLLYLADQGPRAVRRARIILAIALVTAAAILTAHVLTRPPYPIDHPLVRSGEFYAGGVRTVPTFAYLYIAYLGVAMVTVMLLARRYARVAPKVLLRVGLRMTSLGGWFGIAYSIVKLAHVTTQLAGVRADWVPAIAVPLYLVCILLVLLGSTIPVWGPRLGLARVGEWVFRFLIYRAVESLWMAVYRSKPGVALYTPPLTWGAKMRSLWRRPEVTLRRIVELSDGRAELAPYMTRRASDLARAEAAAHQLADGLPTEAAVEAIRIAAAARAAQAIRLAGSEAEAAAARTAAGLDGELDPEQTYIPATSSEEIVWWEMVAWAYDHSPLLVTVLSALSTTAPAMATEPR